MIRLEDLPRDADGIVHGVWRVVHRSPSFHGQLGHLEFREGMGTTPAFGVRLARLVASCGDELFIEQWTGPFPGDFALPEGMRAQLTEAELAKITLAPWRQKIADALEPLTLEVLKLAREEEEDEDAFVVSFADMIREVPKLDGDRAIALRAHIVAMRSELAERGYEQIPKALDGCVTQLDEIIAKIPPREPVKSEPGTSDEATSPIASDLTASETHEQSEAALSALDSIDQLPPVLEETKADETSAAPDAVEVARDVVAKPAEEAIPAIAALSTLDSVRAVQELELLTKKRKTVLAAIDKRVAELMPTP
jgi:hypothetical protein